MDSSAPPNTGNFHNARLARYAARIARTTEAKEAVPDIRTLVND